MRIKDTKNLELLLETLKTEKKDLKNYFVPKLWRKVGDTYNNDISIMNVNPYDYFIEHIERILEYKEKKVRTFHGLNEGIIYNIFPRLTSAFDHDNDGIIGGNQKDISFNNDNIRETGTFLKCIALLGHIFDLKANIIHLLPITTIGKDGNKGTLGSPYAIKNPYKIDPNLNDTLISLDVETQLKAFIEACHLLGMKVIFEFVFRTSSKDADWTKENPQWYYWIDENIPARKPGTTNINELRNSYGPPYFTPDILKIIKEKVKKVDFMNLPAPEENYKDFFKLPPPIEKVTIDSNGKIKGQATDSKTKNEVTCVIPGAFADWPPDDVQPPWSDVTYLRMFVEPGKEIPQYNYIAYNTIRMYEGNLDKPENENTSLWERIKGIIPYWRDEFKINGVMVDMGHAIPPRLMQDIVKTARNNNEEFIFLSENFAIEKKSVEEGYNAVVGYGWSVWTKENGLKSYIDHVVKQGVPINYFGTGENHNTPRAAARSGHIAYSKLCWFLSSVLPMSIPFIHQGFELGEIYPVNTGLDFTPDEIKQYKTLALFDIGHLNWQNKNNIIEFMKNLTDFRIENYNVLSNQESGFFTYLENDNIKVITYKTSSNHGDILVIINPENISQDFKFTNPSSYFENVKSKFEIEGLKLNISGSVFSGTAEPFTGGIYIFG